MAEGIRNGTLSLEDFNNKLKDTAAFEQAATANSEKFGEKLGALKNKLSDLTGKIAGPIISGFSKLIDLFTSLPGKTQEIVLAITAIGVAIGLAFATGPVGQFMLAIGAVITIASLIVENWGPISDFLKIMEDNF